MAQHTIVTLIDDLTDEPADGITTIPFGIDGKSREIDLNPENAAKLREALAPFLDKSRPASSPAPKAPSKPGRPRNSGAPKSADAATRERNQAARTWAMASGRFPDVKERGRLGNDVITEWEKAGSPMPDGSTAPVPAPAASTPEAAGAADSGVTAPEAVHGVAPEFSDGAQATDTAVTVTEGADGAAQVETKSSKRRAGRASVSPTRPGSDNTAAVSELLP